MCECHIHGHAYVRRVHYQSHGRGMRDCMAPITQHRFLHAFPVAFCIFLRNANTSKCICKEEWSTSRRFLKSCRINIHKFSIFCVCHWCSGSTNPSSWLTVQWNKPCSFNPKYALQRVIKLHEAFHPKNDDQDTILKVFHGSDIKIIQRTSVF